MAKKKNNKKKKAKKVPKRREKQAFGLIERLKKRIHGLCSPFAFKGKKAKGETKDFSEMRSIIRGSDNSIEGDGNRYFDGYDDSGSPK